MNKKSFIAGISVLIIVLSATILFFIINQSKNMDEKKNINNSDLYETTWELSEMNGEVVLTKALLIIGNNDVGLSICNSIGYGDIEITESEISFHTEASSTLMACDEPVMTLESELTSKLNKTLKYQINGDKLTITNKDETLVFTKVEDLSD